MMAISYNIVSYRNCRKLATKLRYRLYRFINLPVVKCPDINQAQRIYFLSVSEITSAPNGNMWVLSNVLFNRFITPFEITETTSYFLHARSISPSYLSLSCCVPHTAIVRTSNIIFLNGNNFFQPNAVLKIFNQNCPPKCENLPQCLQNESNSTNRNRTTITNIAYIYTFQILLLSPLSKHKTVMSYSFLRYLHHL